LTEIAAQQGKWQDVVDNTTKQLELKPSGSPEIWYYNALGNYKTGKKDVAEASANKAVTMDPLHTQPNSEQVLAVILADKHDFAGALQHLQNCLKYLPAGPNQDLVKQQIAQLQQMVPKSN
jgi:tetratricopeptide (TPR) repeat protein